MTNEQQITDPLNAYYYAKDKGERCPELEPVIMEGAWAAHWYACDMMKERWKEAEPVIATDAAVTRWYEQHFNCKIGVPNND
jgi:hypothetical protein